MNQRVIRRKIFNRSTHENTIFEDRSFKKERTKYVERGDVEKNERDVYLVGDLNGNAMKMLDFIAMTGLISESIAHKKIFASLQECFEDADDKLSALAKQCSDKKRSPEALLNLFEKFAHERAKIVPPIVDLVGTLTLNEARTKTVRLVFVGDTLADRSYSDAITLAVFEMLSKHGVEFSVAFSNHDADALGKAVHISLWKDGHLSSRAKGPLNLKHLLQSVSFDCDILAGAEFSNACHKRFVNHYLPHLTLIDLEVLYQDRRRVVCATTHAPYHARYAIALEACLREAYATVHPKRIFPLRIPIPGDKLDQLVTNAMNLNTMFRIIVQEFAEDPASKAINFLFPLNGEVAALHDFIWNRDKAVKAHHDFFNVFGHDPDQIKTLLGADGQLVFKKGIAFQQLRDRKEDKSYGTGEAMVDVGNTLCLDNGSGRPGGDEPTLSARIVTVPDKFVPERDTKSNSGDRPLFRDLRPTLYELDEARTVVLRAIDEWNSASSSSGIRLLFFGSQIGDDKKRAAALRTCVEQANDFAELVYVLSLFARGEIDRAAGVKSKIELGSQALATGLMRHMYEIPRLRPLFDLVEVPTAPQLAKSLDTMKQITVLTANRYNRDFEAKLLGQVSEKGTKSP